MSEPEMLAAARPGLILRLRDKLPEIIIEAVSLGLAVLLALAIDGWREQQADVELGRNVLAAVSAEIATNQREVDDTVAAAQALLARLAPLAESSQPPPSGTVIDLNVPLALTSAAAWQAALSGNALHTIGFERSTAIAQIYELQRWFTDAQRRTVDAIFAFGDTADWAQQRPALVRVVRELKLSVEFGTSLQEAYAEHLAPPAPVPETTP
jgi:hypothetical protein